MNLILIKSGKIVNKIIARADSDLILLAQKLNVDEALDEQIVGSGNAGDLWDGISFTTPPKTPEQLAEEARQQAAEAARTELLTDTVSKMTYAEIESYIDTNVTNLASARGFLKRLARVVKALCERG